jgi:hypothetical protein
MVNNYRLIVMLFIALFSYSSWSQVGINTTTPNNGSLLDVDARDKGILIPRINITDLSNIAPIAGLANALEISSAESLLVYNTNTGTGKGFHYWDGTTWISLGDKNLGKDDLTQSEEPRTYDMNGEDLNFTNGAFGINTPSPNGAFEATSTENYNAYTFTQDNSLTGEKDVFTIEDQDVGGGGQDHSSVLKVLKSGNINTGDNGFSLIELANTGTNPGNNKYWISGRTTDEGAPLWGVDVTDNDYWSDGGITLGVTTNSNGTYSNGNFRVNNNGDVGIKNTNPQEALHISGANETIRIEELSTTNTDKIAGELSPVYTDDSGNLTIAPPLRRTFLATPTVIDFIASPGITLSGSGGTVQTSLYSTTIQLSETSLVFVNYHFNVTNIRRQNNSTITDGAPRLFRASVSVNNSVNRIAYDTGTYTAEPDSNGTLANGNYYLSGSAYVELPAGTHDIELFAEGFGGSFDFSYTFGNLTNDLFQIVVHK